MSSERTEWLGKARAILQAIGRRPILWALSILIALWVGAQLGGGPEEAPATEMEAEAQTWYCVMHVQVRQPMPGKCPQCGMDLEPLERTADDDRETAVLPMSRAAMELAEIETVPVERKVVTAEVRMVGKVEFDETRLATITSWVPGRLDRLYVDYTGVPVRRGDHLVSIYSPEVRTAQEELLGAARAAAALEKSHVARETGIANLQAAREKLRLWGLTSDQVEEIEERGTPTDHITIYAPIGGIVIQKDALEGMYVQTGTRIYTIADLSHVWVKLDAYESDLSWIRYGQEVEFRTEAYPGQVFRGRISFIDPVLDDRTRTVKVRVNVENSDRRLKPGMFVRAVVRARVGGAGLVMDPSMEGKWICPMHPEVIADGPGPCDLCGMDLVEASELGYKCAGEGEPSLVIPASAPLITGKRAVVYVRLTDREEPTFEGREVVLGPRAGDHYLVESGIEEGDEVVVRGAFKIDSALQIQAKPSMMSREGGAPPAGHAHGEHTSRPPPKREGVAIPPPLPPADAVPAALGKRLESILEGYLKIHAGLYAKDATVAADAARGVRETLEAEKEDRPEGEIGEAWEEVAKDLTGALDPFLAADDLKGQRAAFPGVTEALTKMLARLDWPGRPDLYRLHCPMAFGMGKGADWLQRDERVRNPYFGEGEAMQACGTVKGPVSGGKGE